MKVKNLMNLQFLLIEIQEMKFLTKKRKLMSLSVILFFARPQKNLSLMKALIWWSSQFSSVSRWLKKNPRNRSSNVMMKRAREHITKPALFERKRKDFNDGFARCTRRDATLRKQEYPRTRVANYIHSYYI